jgi:P27 family predicted phage terminase small subunit
MGLRGPAPKPTALRKLEGIRGHRPLHEDPKFSGRIPNPPRRMSGAAKKVWIKLVPQLVGAHVLKTVDQDALWMLCEDTAMWEEALLGIRVAKGSIVRKAKAEGKQESLRAMGGPLMALASSREGERMIRAYRNLEMAVDAQRRQFGLTPAARTRIDADDGDFGADIDDPIEAALCG